MKTYILKSFVLPLLLAGFAGLTAGQVSAQTYALVYGFSDDSDGSNPSAGLVLSGGVLYGVADGGGSLGEGSVFAVNTDGTGFTNVYSFTNGSDGANPRSELILAGSTLYGTARLGGSAGDGTVFAVNTDGTGFRVLHSFTAVSDSFTNGDGAEPFGGLVLAGQTLYGTAQAGGGTGNGTVFAVNTNGLGFTNLYNFTALVDDTNSDGASPESELILAGRTLYGTAYAGGPNGSGTVFAITTNGTGFTALHAFQPLEVNGGNGSFTNGDGANPVGGLILGGGRLYGTTVYGGTNGSGTVYAINTNGSGFTSLHVFTAVSDTYTNSDGIQPFGGLVLAGNTVYGTTEAGGGTSDGTVFAVTTNGTGFVTVFDFDEDDNFGAGPTGGLLLSGNTLYGTTTAGDDPDDGTVYSLAFTPSLAINQSTTNVVLTWPTNVAGFDYTGYTLHCTTNLNPAVWHTASPAPVVINAQDTVTNPVAGPQKFFRLSNP